VKTLRFYHEEQILVPSSVDRDTGYRYYGDEQIPQARLIAFLRSLEFPLADIREILRHQDDQQPLLAALAKQKDSLEQKIKNYRTAVRSLEKFIADEGKAHAMAQANFEVQEKTVGPMLVAGIRMRGRYGDCGKAFGRLGRTLGRHIYGPPLLLLYDDEYREDDADFEACMPIRLRKEADGINLRELPGGRCLSLVHQGPYDQLGHSYAQILKHLRAQKLDIVMPTREVYLKGPGMVFRGNPRNYLTEIQILVDGGGRDQ
jgi:DNA-binding transcriptional MerR regulator/DNA gyrase inhibitor GyrI